MKGSKVEEKVFYEKGSVKITDSRFIVGNVTYVLANITSVSKGKSNIDVWIARIWAFILIAIGVAVLSDRQFMAISLFFIVPGVLILYFTKLKYIVSLATASGAVMAYTSKNEEEIDTIVKELNNAFISM